MWPRRLAIISSMNTRTIWNETEMTKMEIIAIDRRTCQSYPKMWRNIDINNAINIFRFAIAQRHFRYQSSIIHQYIGGTHISIDLLLHSDHLVVVANIDLILKSNKSKPNMNRRAREREAAEHTYFIRNCCDSELPNIMTCAFSTTHIHIQNGNIAAFHRQLAANLTTNAIAAAGNL